MTRMVHLRRLALTLTMAVLISVTLFLPCVKADVQLSQEFVEPIKNWSFEEIGSSVCECPPWTSNNGGYRDPRSDVNGDGKVTSSDILFLQIVVTKIAKGILTQEEALAQYPQCDVNGDGKISSADVLQVLIDVTKIVQGLKTINRLDGKYSWYTNGGGDYEMWQWLDPNKVKDNEVTFSFWFLPESVAPDGLQNYARAEIFVYYLGVGWWEVAGDWVYPTETKWHSAFVSAFIGNAALVRVKIHGKPDFKAWIDYTSLSITETKLATETWSDLGMRMKLAVNLFEFKDYATPIDPLKAYFGIAMSADIDKSESWYHVYFIEIVELEVKLISGSYARITNVTQSNDIDYKTDPDQSQKIENEYIVARNTAIKGILTLGVFFLSPSIPYNIGKLFLSGTAFVAGTVLLKTYRSNSDYTDNPDVPARAKINYAFASGFVRFASEGAILELGFGSSCQVEVTARARVSAVDKATGLIVHIRTLEETISVTLSP